MRIYILSQNRSSHHRTRRDQRSV